MSHQIRFVNIKRIPNTIAGLLGIMLSFFILFDGFNNESIRILGVISIPIWIFLIVDSVMPNKFLISDSEFGIKHSIFWKKWKWSEIDSIYFVDKKWLGFETSLIVVETKNGVKHELEETRLSSSESNRKSQKRIKTLEKIFSKQVNRQKIAEMS